VRRRRISRCFAHITLREVRHVPDPQARSAFDGLIRISDESMRATIEHIGQ
jgi:hypothetical protein